MPGLTDIGTAESAGKACPVIHEIMLLKIAGLSVHTDEIAQAAAALLDCCRQNMSYGQNQPLVACQPDPASRRTRMNACAKQAF